MTPLSTYRLQLHAGFGFDAAGAIADYLHALGVTHIYCSPYLQAMAGSTHGYDVVNHHRVNQELGGPEAHSRFCLTLGRNQLGQILDIVPNHMAIGGRGNAWWWDVLENGQSSRYASYFDVDWSPPEERLRNKVLLPVLGDRYGRVLADGEIQIARQGGEFVARYFDHEFPLAPDSWDRILAGAAPHGNSDLLAFLADSCARLPAPTDTDYPSILARHRDKEVIRELLERLCREDERAAAAVDEEVRKTNADPDRLHALLERQSYRLSYWRTAERELGYRRFFDVNTLVGMRMENVRVFTDTHRLILDWLERGVLDGVRVDHPDGLRDPDQYFRRLREYAPKAYIIAEKILEPGEEPRAWDIAGTVGYDFLNMNLGLFVDSASEKLLTDFYTEFTGLTADYATVALEKKQSVLRDVLGSDVNRLTALFIDVCEGHRERRDYTRHDIHHALREIVAMFPVYRTYAQAAKGKITDQDAEYIHQAINAAAAARPDLDRELFEFIRGVLVLEVRGERESDFVMQFQQFSGPAMAKGVEDTAFYCYNRLIALNEVGGDPGRFGICPEEFHRYCIDRQAHWPGTMNASSTHDTKRSEDVRARISLISEIPERWVAAVRRWSEWNAPLKTAGVPDANTEYLLYQTLLGTWPIDPERLCTYMHKAAREAKEQTCWTDPNRQFETELELFARRVLESERFRDDFEEFAAPLIEPARIHSLAQTLIKFTAPGVPDTYQGCEIWDLSLVDPDNRRPVDFDLRRALLAQLDHVGIEEICRRMEEGLPKLWVVKQALALRRERPAAFGAEGTYQPLEVSGPNSRHIVAYARGGEVITVVPRLVLRSRSDYSATNVALPAGRWRNVLTGEDATTEIDILLGRFPVALLARTAE